MNGLFFKLHYFFVSLTKYLYVLRRVLVLSLAVPSQTSHFYIFCDFLPESFYLLVKNLPLCATLAVFLDILSSLFYVQTTLIPSRISHPLTCTYFVMLCCSWHYNIELVNTSELSSTLVFSILTFSTQNHKAFTGYKRSPDKNWCKL